MVEEEHREEIMGGEVEIEEEAVEGVEEGGVEGEVLERPTVWLMM